MHNSSSCLLLQEYTPAAEVLIQQAKAPGADGGSYINAAKHVAPAPQVCLPNMIACTPGFACQSLPYVVGNGYTCYRGVQIEMHRPGKHSLLHVMHTRRIALILHFLVAYLAYAKASSERSHLSSEQSQAGRLCFNPGMACQSLTGTVSTGCTWK